MSGNNKFDARQSKLKAAQPMIGSAVDASLDGIFPLINNQLAKLFEDRNILLTDGGFITWASGQVQFTESLKLHINSQVAGGAPTVIDLGSTTRTIANNSMMYAVIDRAAGTAVITIATTLPAVVAANQEVVIIAKRVDSGDGVQRIYFRTGMALSEGETARLGASGSGSGSGGAGIGDDLDSLSFLASFTESFEELPADANNSIDFTSNKTDSATYSVVNKYLRMAYDASKTVTGTGTSMVMSAAPAFAVKIGDTLKIGAEARIITVIGSVNTDGGSGTPMTISSAFTTNPTAAAANVSQTIYTKDLNNLALDGVPISTVLPDAVSQIMVKYSESVTSGSTIPVYNATAKFAYTASADGSAYSGPLTKPNSLTDITPITTLPASGSNLYLRFFSNATSGSGSVNLLDFKVYFHRDPEAGAGGDETALEELYSLQHANYVQADKYKIQPTDTPGAPASGFFYSSIQNRSPINDPTKDLKARYGVERIRFQLPIGVPYEFGPNAEKVMRMEEDRDGLVRFVGNAWIGVYNGLTQGLSTVSSTDYVEITFKGRGLIFITDYAASRDFRISIDGGAEGSNVEPGFSGPHAQALGFNCDFRIVAANNLTDGVHTVRIRQANGGTFSIFGVDILNDTANIEVAGGVAFIDNKKVMASPASFPITTAVTGSRGGRVGIMLNQAGVIAPLFRAPDSMQTFSNTDHSNEEVVSDMHFRNMGNVDDQLGFPWALANGTATRFGFEEDNQSILYADQTNHSFQNTPALDSFVLSGNGNNYVGQTFKGTGFDILYTTNADPGSTNLDTDVYIDDVHIGTMSLPTGRGVMRAKVVSGLTNDTHLIKFIRTTNTNPAIFFHSFISYGVKKVDVPAGSIMIGDYCVPPAFSMTAPSTTSMSRGVNRHTIFKETGVLGPANFSGADGNILNLIDIVFQANGMFITHIFHGEGMEIRYTSNTDRVPDGLIEVMDLTNGGGWVTLNTTNFPGLTTGGAGNSSFNPSTGELAMNGALNQGGNSFWFNGLPIAVYNIRLSNPTGGYITINTWDVMEPIWSHRTERLASVKLGGNCINDIRRLKPYENEEGKRIYRAYGRQTFTGQIGSGIPAQYTNMPDMWLLVNNHTGSMKIKYDVAAQCTAGSLDFQIFVNNTPIGRPRTLPSNVIWSVSDEINLENMPIGIYKVELRWISGGNYLANNQAYSMEVEIKE